MKSVIARYAKSTYRPEVLSGVGFFGGLFELRGYRKPVLVSSVDGVGTKLKIASIMDRHDTVGVDLVNHCVNDIFTGGADPLFFLDYIAMGKLVPERVEAIVRGLAHACCEVNCALIGGETAQMPGVYAGDDYDLVGCIIGVVEKDKIVMSVPKEQIPLPLNGMARVAEKDRIFKGQTIIAGDVIIGLPSSGLHTNGYSLVRRIFGPEELHRNYLELGRTLGEALLEPHRCYYNELKSLLAHVKGLAHITGGGLIDNVPRILPAGLTARFHSQSWTVLPVFQLIQRQGNVTLAEMYHVFNMGIGMVVVCSQDEVSYLLEKLPGASVVGEIVTQVEQATVMIDSIVGKERGKVA